MSADPGLWTPLRQGSVSDLIARRIMEVITTDKLKPGDQLPPERELATMLGTSRPSLREALQSLKARGYLDIRHGAGVFVADPATTRTLRQAMSADTISITELFEMREVLELPAAEWAARTARTDGPRKLTSVQAAYSSLLKASDPPVSDWALLGRLDAQFHMRIVEAAGNRFLTRTNGVLQEILAKGMDTTLQIPGRLERARNEHQHILEALLAGDPVAARRAARNHIRSARSAALRRKPDPPRYPAQSLRKS
jgi:GntR family transcriptional regulator, transcriptional repressor for pyruvate dehydrogenase complex